LIWLVFWFVSIVGWLAGGGGDGFGDLVAELLAFGAFGVSGVVGVAYSFKGGLERFEHLRGGGDEPGVGVIVLGLPSVSDRAHSLSAAAPVMIKFLATIFCKDIAVINAFSNLPRAGCVLKFQGF